MTDRASRPSAGPAVGGARTLHWVDRSGRAEQLPLPPRSYLHPRLSPDATRLSIEIEGSDHDVHVYDFCSGVLSNITTDGVSHCPSGRRMVGRIGYRSGAMGRFEIAPVAQCPSRIECKSSAVNWTALRRPAPA